MLGSINKDLLYWLGVMQSDGRLEFYTDRRGKKNLSARIYTSRKSIAMVTKVAKISKAVLGRTSKIFFMRSRPDISHHVGFRKLLPDFIDLDMKVSDPPKPPIWIYGNDVFIGAYLAGLIDGDGDIRIKRKKYPQCAIRITSSKAQSGLRKMITSALACSVSINHMKRRVFIKQSGKFVDGEYYVLEFLVSSKNKEFVENYILPEISLKWKREKLAKFLEN